MNLKKPAELKGMFDDELVEYKDNVFFEIRRQGFNRELANAFFDVVKVLDYRQRFQGERVIDLPCTA